MHQPTSGSRTREHAEVIVEVGPEWSASTAWAREEQARLLEMIADDDAALHGDRLSVAGALIRLAGGAVPAAAPAVAAAQMEYCPITSTISIA